MNTKLIKQAVLAAAVFAGGGMAYGEDNYQDLQVVYCKATIVGSSAEQVVSVTLPPTEGYYDMEGNPLTYWNVGNVPAGGVADSWHGDGGPGRFTARNAGNVGTYFYVKTRWEGYEVDGDYFNAWENVSSDNLAGNANVHGLHFPSISLSELRRWNDPQTYHLAFTTDTMAKVPTWHSLDHRYSSSYEWSAVESDSPTPTEVAGYMGYVDAGDYLTFDMKFWAPPRESNSQEGAYLFTFAVEASSFPLWDHGRTVE